MHASCKSGSALSSIPLDERGMRRRVGRVEKLFSSLREACPLRVAFDLFDLTRFSNQDSSGFLYNPRINGALACLLPLSGINDTNLRICG